MSDQVRPFPDIGPAAWTVLLRAAEGQRITATLASEIVGPALAGEALAHLDAKHLLDDGEFSPLARTIPQMAPRTCAAMTTWTPQADAILRAGLAASIPYAEIGKALGLSRGAVAGRAHRLGLPLRSPQNAHHVRRPRPAQRH